MTTKELIQGKTISIDWQFTSVEEWHDSNWGVWNLDGIGSDGRKYIGTCQADGTDPEGCHDNEVYDIDLVREAKPEPVEPKTDMSTQYAITENELLKYGIYTKIKTFQELENATLKLNKLYQDELNY